MRSRDPLTLRTLDIWTFKSQKSNKRYIVEVEVFGKHFYGLKFYWKAVADSNYRYSILTNDYEPRRIVMSCIDIMLRYFNSDKLASFGFVGAPDITPANGCPNKRFRFYRRMMLSLFSTDKFIQVNDRKRAIYLLVNKSMFQRGDISISEIECEISNLYAGEFHLSEE